MKRTIYKGDIVNRMMIEELEEVMYRNSDSMRDDIKKMYEEGRGNGDAGAVVYYNFTQENFDLDDPDDIILQVHRMDFQGLEDAYDESDKEEDYDEYCANLLDATLDNEILIEFDRDIKAVYTVFGDNGFIHLERYSDDNGLDMDTEDN